MAYDIKYNLLDKRGDVVGSATGVFEAAAHQALGEQRLFSFVGRCGSSARLAYVNAYDNTGDGNSQPDF
ncbi:hypothetical protein ACF1BB_27085 [Streptomyces griseoluteus]|uniref:hypothetical protein n=1 Tax=Streptomyces griseoluteus TaxID=29306 RepID=UPI0036FC2607